MLMAEIKAHARFKANNCKASQDFTTAVMLIALQLGNSEAGHRRRKITASHLPRSGHIKSPQICLQVQEADFTEMCHLTTSKRALNRMITYIVDFIETFIIHEQKAGSLEI
jgi:hypothetical protein